MTLLACGHDSNEPPLDWGGGTLTYYCSECNSTELPAKPRKGAKPKKKAKP